MLIVNSINDYSVRELIELSAIFVGIESGTYKDGQGLLIENINPFKCIDYAYFNKSLIWNPLESELDKWIIQQEYIRRGLSTNFPNCPDDVDYAVYQRQIITLEAAEMTFKNGLVSPFKSE